MGVCEVLVVCVVRQRQTCQAPRKRGLESESRILETHAIREIVRTWTMITVKASQKLFTHAEVANLTGICVEHLRSAAKRFRLGFIAQSFEEAGTQAEQWLFTPWDLTVLVTLFPRCTH